MALEDAAVLAKLFSHLLNYEQIQSFLHAFQDLRQQRCYVTREKELEQILFLSLPDGEQQRMRDAAFKERAALGLSPVLIPNEVTTMGSNWESIKELFCYDAEDEADNWWISWGLLRERANQTEIRENVVAIQVSVDQVS
jgi:salicylate hydroxylase